MTLLTPNYRHDCTSCVLIGHATRKNDEVGTTEVSAVDVYICEQGGIPTSIIRFSDSGPDYSSRPLVLWPDEQRGEIAKLIAHAIEPGGVERD